MVKFQREHWLPFFVVLFWAVGLIYSDSVNIISFYDFHRILNVMACVLASLAFTWASRRDVFYVDKLWTTVIVYFAYLLFRVPFAEDRFGSIELFNIFFLVLAFKAISSPNNKDFSLSVFFKVIVFSFAVYYFLVLVELIKLYFAPLDWNIHVLAVGFDNVRFLNQIQVIAFPLFVYGAICFKGRWQYSSVFSVVFTIAFIFYSNARGALLLTTLESIALAAISIIYFKYSRTHVLYKIVCYWLLGVLIYSLLFYLYPQFIYKGISGVNSVELVEMRLSSTGRLAIWQEAISVWLQKPIIGYGPLSYAHGDYGFTLKFGHPHNSVIQILFEYGLFGLFLVLLMFLKFVKQSYFYFRNGQESVRFEMVFLAVAIVGGLGLSLLSGVIVMPLSQMLMIVCFGVFWYVIRNSFPSGLKLYLFRFSGQFVLFFTAFVAIGFVLLTYFNYFYVVERVIEANDLRPRFWLYGRLI